MIALAATGTLRLEIDAASAASGADTSAASGTAGTEVSGASGTAGWSSGASTSDCCRSFVAPSERPNLLIARAICTPCACRSALHAHQVTALRGRAGSNRAMIAANMRRPRNGAHVPAHASPYLVARGVQIVSWLMGRPAGETRDELRQRFGWPVDELRDVLDHLAERCQVRRVGERYLATSENKWRTGAR
ncbi:MAG: hypothetical protein HS111_34760 [Kofleriaceae bacterium]|nr:hypothetical protein [Kofleriaceae bacterium]